MIQGWSMKEIADSFDCSQVTIETRLAGWGCTPETRKEEAQKPFNIEDYKKYLG